MENQASITKYLLLMLLKKRQMHGYEIITEIAKITGNMPSTSQIYPLLKKLNYSGHITSFSKTEGKKKIRVYKITKSGIRLFDEISKRFDSIISASISNKIKTCAHCRCEIIKGAIKKGENYFCCESCLKSFIIKK